MTRAAVFLDRDGTLIVDAHYPRDPAVVALLPGAAEALRTYAAAGYALVVISNQSGLGRGLITPAEAAAVHARFVALHANAGVTFTATYYCPHAPEADCACRKPRPELLLRAAADHALDLARSIMIGDKPSDEEAGRAAGCAASYRFVGVWPSLPTAAAR